MVHCEYCGERMTSAPSHMEHAEECKSAKLWDAVNALVRACGGYPNGAKGASPEAEGLRDKINRLAGTKGR